MIKNMLFYWLFIISFPLVLAGTTLEERERIIKFSNEQLIRARKVNGIIVKGVWQDNISPIEVEILRHDFDWLSRINKQKNELFKMMKTRQKFNEQSDFKNAAKMEAITIEALEMNPDHAGNYKHKKAPYDENHFSSYLANLKELQYAQDENYTFYTVKFQSNDERKQKVNNEIMILYGKWCQFFIFFNRNDEFAFIVVGIE